MFIKTQCSAHCSSSCLKHESSALGTPGRTCMQMTLLSSLKECQEALDLERSNGKERTENEGKMKIMICGMGLDLLQSSGKFPCTVCHTGVGGSNIFCNSCKHWVYKKCSGLKRLTKDPDYRCTQCQSTACFLNGRQQNDVQVGSDKLEVVASFCYLGDMLSAAGGCELSTTTHMKTTWKRWPCLQLLCAECNASCQ